MNLKILKKAALLAAIGLVIPTVALSQPNRRTGSYVPGYWQPQAQISPGSNIKVTLLNQSGLTITYGSPTQLGERMLAPGGSVDLYFDEIGGASKIVSLNIYAREELDYDYNSNPNMNQVFVRIRQAGDLARADKAVYIDETGRVYSF